jgi:3-mercaptopyruvate sulfurtransferase SseA
MSRAEMNLMWQLFLDRVEHFQGGMRANDEKHKGLISAGQEKIKTGQEWLRATICANQQDMRAVMSEMRRQLVSIRTHENWQETDEGHNVSSPVIPGHI